MPRLPVGALVLVLGLLLSGCSSDKADGSSSPSASPTPSVTASPTPSPPDMPPEAHANTKAGAIAFVRHYVALLNHAQATGDIEALRPYSADACKSCTQVTGAIADLYQSGGRIEGGAWQLSTVHALSNQAIKGWVVDAAVSYGSQSVIYGDGRPPKTNRGGKLLVSFQVSRQDDAWKVREWTRAS